MLNSLRDRFIRTIGSNFFLISLASFSISYVFLAARAILLRTEFGIISYHKTVYAVNYFTHGFAKRGLVGTLLSFLPLSVDPAVAAIVINALSFIGVALMVRAALERMAEDSSRFLLGSMFALSPFTAFQFGFEVGRLDIVNILIFLICVKLILAGSVYVACGLIVIGILVHEAFAIYAAPLLLALAAVKTKRDDAGWQTRDIVRLLALIGCVAVPSYIVYRFGNNDLVVSQTPGYGQEAWSRALVQTGWSHLSKFDLTMAALCIAAVYTLYFFVYFANRWKIDYYCAGALFPVALFVLGWDYARWCSLCFIVALVALYLRSCDSRNDPGIASAGWLAALFVIPVGPAGYMAFFPFLRWAWGRLHL